MNRDRIAELEKDIAEEQLHCDKCEGRLNVALCEGCSVKGNMDDFEMELAELMEDENRLTQQDDLGNWGVKRLPWRCLYKGEVITEEIHEKLYGCLAKLKDYEKTGLSPTEVEDLVEKSKPAAAVITGHNNAINTDIGKCPKCNGLPIRACDFKYCPECGQKIDWLKGAKSKYEDN